MHDNRKGQDRLVVFGYPVAAFEGGLTHRQSCTSERSYWSRLAAQHASTSSLARSVCSPAVPHRGLLSLRRMRKSGHVRVQRQQYLQA